MLERVDHSPIQATNANFKKDLQAALLNTQTHTHTRTHAYDDPDNSYCFLATDQVIYSSPGKRVLSKATYKLLQLTVGDEWQIWANGDTTRILYA